MPSVVNSSIYFRDSFVRLIMLTKILVKESSLDMNVLPVYGGR